VTAYVQGPPAGPAGRSTLGVFEVANPDLEVVATGLLRAGIAVEVAVPGPGQYLVRGFVPGGERLSGILQVNGTPGEISIAQLPARGIDIPPPARRSGWIAAWRPGPDFEPVDSTAFEASGAGLAIDYTAAAGENVVLQWSTGDRVQCTAAPTGSPVRLVDGSRLEFASDEAHVLLGFLDQGDLTHAGILAEPVLESVPQDVTLAVATGYYLLNAADERLAQWSRDLIERWPRLFDAHLLQAWACLYSADSWQDAGTALRDATRCGLPLAARGLRLLDDALRRVAAVADQGPEAVRVRFLPYLRAVDDPGLTSFTGQPQAPGAVVAVPPPHARTWRLADGRIHLTEPESPPVIRPASSSTRNAETRSSASVTARALLTELDTLYRAAGRPSLRRISMEIRRNNQMPETVSHETVGAILRGDPGVSWSKVECVVRQLAAMSIHRPDPDREVRRLHATWSDAFWRPAPSAARFPSGLVPSRDAAFTGRRDHLELMAATLHDRLRLPLILHGLSGVGKTQLAVEYLHRHAAEYEMVGWITAEDPLLATAELAALGERQGWPTGSDLAQTIRTVLSRLESSSVRWLLIYDNAAAPYDIHPLLPSGGGDVLVTTRDGTWLDRGTPVEVGVFTRAESIELLRTRGHSIEPNDAHQLAERLGDLPLALQQVAAMQADTRVPVREYLRRLDIRGMQELRSAPPGAYPTSVVTAFELSVDQLRAESLAGAQFLEMASCLGVEPISLTLLRAGGGQLPPPLGRMLNQPDTLTDAIHRLRRYGLMKVTSDGVQVHRLVQAIVRDMLPEAAREQAYANARRLLTAANPARPADPAAWDMYQRIGPHLPAARMVEATEPDARQTVLDHATYLYETGDYEGSLRLCEQAGDQWSLDGATGDVQVIECRQLAVAARHALGRF